MKEPTEAQVKFAKRIHIWTDIPLPSVMSRQSLFLYIRDNLPKFKVAQEQYRLKQKKEYERYLRENCSNKGRKYYSDNCYAGAYGSDDVDCFDYGIYPWGDS